MLASWTVLMLMAAPPGFPGMTAEVEVVRDGRIQHGRIIMEAGGRLHLEHLDPATAAWCRRLMERVTRGEGEAARGGWDDRAGLGEGKPIPGWATVGQFRVLGEVHVAAGGVCQRVRLLHHRLHGGQP